MRRAKLISGEQDPIFRHDSLPIGQQPDSLENVRGARQHGGTRLFRACCRPLCRLQTVHAVSALYGGDYPKLGTVLNLREILDVALRHEAKGTCPSEAVPQVRGIARGDPEVCFFPTKRSTTTNPESFSHGPIPLRNDICFAIATSRPPIPSTKPIRREDVARYQDQRQNLLPGLRSFLRFFGFLLRLRLDPWSRLMIEFWCHLVLKALPQSIARRLCYEYSRQVQIFPWSKALVGSNH
jgi:hypothetical protein